MSNFTVYGHKQPSTPATMNLVCHGMSVIHWVRPMCTGVKDTPWIFIVSGSPAHAYVPYAYKELAIGDQTHYSRWIQGSCASCKWPNDDANVILCGYGTYYQSRVHAG